MKKNKILVTGGAGFVGSNLIEFLLNNTKYKIISIDNYSSGFTKNHIKNSRVKYISGDTKNIEKLIKNPNDINSIFHFGEFARIYQKDYKKFKNLKYLVVDCLRFKFHPSHFNVDDILKLNILLNPKKMILTNLLTDLDYNNLLNILPNNIKPAYDGLSLNF